MRNFTALSLIATCAAFLSTAVLGGGKDTKFANRIHELNPEMPFKQFMELDDFSIISFYNEEIESSKTVDDYMDRAAEIMGEKIQSLEWSKRKVGWYRVNVAKHPTMALDETAQPAQFITGGGWTKMLNFETDAEKTKEENEEQLAELLNKYTGDWLTKIECKEIGEETRGTLSELILFGDPEKLIDDFEASQLRHLAQLERFKFDEEVIKYRYNRDPECWKSLGLLPDKNYITVHLWNNDPVILQLGNKENEDKVKMPKLLNLINTGLASGGHNKWGSRAETVVFDLKHGALIYYTGDEEEAREDDWRMQLMSEVNDLIRYYQLVMIPVVGGKAQDAALPEDVKRLHEVMKLQDDEKLPQLFLYHPVGGKAVRYPHPLVDDKSVTAKNVVVWANISLLTVEVEFLKNKIMVLESENESPEGEKTPPEQIQSIKDLLAKKEDELKDLQTSYAEIMKVIDEVVKAEASEVKEEKEEKKEEQKTVPVDDEL